jgi:GntR family transcriptional regulator/MocR family aminotransferase
MLARTNGLEVIHADVDDDGVRVSDLASAHAAIVTPAHQFPLGVTTSPARRRELVAWAESNGSWLIENDYDAEFRYDKVTIGAVQGLAPGRTIYIGTVSKTLAPAVRFGWIVFPPALCDVATGFKHSATGSTGLTGAAMLELLRSGGYERHIVRCRREYRRRRDILVAEIARSIPEARVLGSAGGLHLTLELPPRYDTDAAAEAAAGAGISVKPLSHYEHPGRHRRCGLVIGYGSVPTHAAAGMIAELARHLQVTSATN